MEVTMLGHTQKPSRPERRWRLKPAPDAVRRGFWRGGNPLQLAWGGRVEMWRGGLGAAYPFPALSSAGASLSAPCSVSTSRSSNPSCGSPAMGSRRKYHDFAHEKLRVRSVNLISPKRSNRLDSGIFLYPGHATLCLAHNHRRSRLRACSSMVP